MAKNSRKHGKPIAAAPPSERNCPEQEEPYFFKVLRGEEPSVLFGDRFMTDAAKQKMKEARAAADDLADQALKRKLKERRELKELRAEIDQIKENERLAAVLPTCHELRYKRGSLTQKKAAEYLCCTTRTIRNWLKVGKLVKTKTGKVECEDRFIRKYRELHPAVLMQ